MHVSNTISFSFYISTLVLTSLIITGTESPPPFDPKTSYDEIEKVRIW